MTPLRIRLRELRLAKGLTQVELARKAGIRQATVSGLETGRTKRVDFPVLERLAAVLGVAPHRLFQTVRRGAGRSRS
jgi:transcriptional regulator with XRE-family HTH domain